MNILNEFYSGPEVLQQTLVNGVQAQLRQRMMSSADLDQLCEFQRGTWSSIVANPKWLTKKIILDICFEMELEIESVMPLEINEDQIKQVCQLMAKEEHGVVALSSVPASGSPRPDSELTPSASHESTSLARQTIPYRQQARLYIRLMALDQLTASLNGNCASANRN